MDYFFVLKITFFFSENKQKEGGKSEFIFIILCVLLYVPEIMNW